MKNYDLQLSHAKQAATEALMELSNNADARHMAGALDALNLAWDELTNALVRQRQERDRQITRLIDELAEARKQ